MVKKYYSNLMPKIPMIRLLTDPEHDDSLTQDELMTYDADGSRKA